MLSETGSANVPFSGAPAFFQGLAAPFSVIREARDGGRPVCASRRPMRGSRLRGLSGDRRDVGAGDADIEQVAVGIAGEFVDDVPVKAALFEEASNEGEFHNILFSDYSRALLPDESNLIYCIAQIKSAVR